MIKHMSNLNNSCTKIKLYTNRESHRVRKENKLPPINLINLTPFSSSGSSSSARYPSLRRPKWPGHHLKTPDFRAYVYFIFEFNLYERIQQLEDTVDTCFYERGVATPNEICAD